MKFVIPNHFPLEGSGSGIYTQNVALELTRMGHEVCVITPEHSQLRGYPYEVRNILFSNGENQEASLPFNFPCFTTHPVSSNTFENLSDEEIKIYVDTFQKTIDRAVADISPDLMHVQHLWVATFCASRTGVPYVATVHGTDLMGYEKDARYRAMAEQGAEKAEKIISISSQITDKTQSIYGVPDSKIATILNGFSTDIFHIMDSVDREDIFTEFSIPPAEKLICFVGKLTEFKGIDVLIRAAAIYEKELGSAATLIIGMGELREELHRLVSDLGLEHVHFIGHQPQTAVARINNAADLSVFPSRVEPFGLVAIEALACGTPVVTTNRGGFPDFINDNVGRMVDVDSHTQLAQAVIEEITSDAKLNKGPYAAEYAAGGFSWKKKVKEFCTIYEHAAGSPQ